MFQNILMTTDFSDCSRSAAEMALEMAKVCGANAHLLHATCSIHEVSPFFEQANYDETEILMEPEERVERGMTSLIGGMDVDTDDIYKVQVRGNTETGSIISYARENPIDLMVMGAHGRNVGERMLGSVARRLIAAAPCPVLLSKESDTSPGAFRKILLPVDFAHINPEAIANACELAGLFGGTIQLLQVVTDPDRVMEAIMVTGQAKEALNKMVPEQVSIEVGVVAGEPSTAIAEFAEEHHSDLIYIPRYEQDATFVNRVVEGLLKDADCPICVGPGYL